MSANYSKTLAVSETGAINGRVSPVVEFMPTELDALIITGDVPFYWGFNDASQAVIPVLSNGSVTFNSQDFQNGTIKKILSLLRAVIYRRPLPAEMMEQTIKIFVKRQAAGDVNIGVGYLGGNI